VGQALHQKYTIGQSLFAYGIIIIFTLIVTLASIWTFTFTLAPLFKGLISAFIFLIIPFLYLGVYVFANKKIKRAYNLVDKGQQYKWDVVRLILIYIVVMLLLFFIFLISLYFPLEKKGINNFPLNVTIQPYLLNDSAPQYNKTLFLAVNKIYSEYNITVLLNDPIYLDLNINESEKTKIFQQNCSTIDWLYNFTRGKRELKLIFMNNSKSADGMASFCGKGDLIIVSTGSSMPYEWVLSHELGHVLNARISCWRFNLMKEYSRACYGANWVTHDFIRDLRPDFLNQEQVNAITNSVKTRFA
jgi:hypothetical protein